MFAFNTHQKRAVIYKGGKHKAVFKLYAFNKKVIPAEFCVFFGAEHLVYVLNKRLIFR